MDKPKINKVYIVYKHSVYEKYVLNEKNPGIIDLLNQGHESTEHLVDTHNRHLQAIEKIQTILKNLGVNHRVSARTNLKTLEGCNLILSVGGDGTFLRTARYVNNQVLVGINSVPSQSVGALCQIRVEELEAKIKRLIEGDYTLVERLKIQISINDTPYPSEPVNDVLFTNISPAATSRYLIKFEGLSEEHKSSGLWISTPAGSTAAISAAGGHPQNINDQNLQFLVREPYQGLYNDYRIISGFLSEGSELNLVSKMIKSKLYLDGPTKFVPIQYGDKITIRVSDRKLKTAMF